MDSLIPRSAQLESRTSPLRSPGSINHFKPIQPDINYPAEFSDFKPYYKQMAIGPDGWFRASVDVRDYKPEGIKVKAVGHTIVIELSHGDEVDEYGTVSRKSVEKYVLPPKMDMEKTSSYTSKGVLYVKVPPMSSEVPERIIEVIHNVSKDEKPSA